MPADLSDVQTKFLERYLGIKVPSGAPGASGNLIRKRAFLISRWQRIPVDLQLEVSSIAQAVERDLPEEDAATFAANLRQYLTGMSADMQSRIGAAVDKAVNAGDNSYAAVATVIRALRAEIAGDALLRTLAASPLVPGNGFISAFSGALDEIEQSLTA